MRISAKVLTIDIFDLFRFKCDVDVSPFDDYRVATMLNKEADELYPDATLNFLCPTHTGNGNWVVFYEKNRYKAAPTDAYYPDERCYTLTQVKRNMPKGLVKILKHLDGAHITV